MKLKINSVIAWSGLSFLCVLLLACDPKQQTNTDWVKDEILQQLAELRKDIKSLKNDVAKLDDKLSNVGKRRVATAPKQVKLNPDIVLGNVKAKLAIVEFTDYQCPFCARHYKSVFPKIKEKLINTGKVKYVIYDFPLDFHSQAKSAAVAARCAGKQGKYWEMHGALFYNQRTLNKTFYEKTAKDWQLDAQAFAACLNDTDMVKSVESNMDYGKQLGVSGTPKFFVGNVEGEVMTNVIVINGAQPFGAFADAIRQLSKQ